MCYTLPKGNPMKKEWIKNLNVGDKVACKQQCREYYNIYTVKRFTKTTVVVITKNFAREEIELKFGYDGFSKPYCAWNHSLLVPYTKEIEAINYKYKLKRLIPEKFQTIDLTNLTVDELEQIYHFLNDFIKEK